MEVIDLILVCSEQIFFLGTRYKSRCATIKRSQFPIATISRAKRKCILRIAIIINDNEHFCRKSLLLQLGRGMCLTIDALRVIESNELNRIAEMKPEASNQKMKERGRKRAIDQIRFVHCNSNEWRVNSENRKSYIQNHLICYL